MPLHLNSISNDNQNSDILAWIFREGMDECDSLFVSLDKLYFHLQRKITDSSSGDKIGKIVYTIFRNEEEKALEIKDIDIVFSAVAPSTLRFLYKRVGSSDSNEYYDVIASDNEQHLEIETVNRYTVRGDIVDTEREVYISVFPFELSVFENIFAFNRWAGFSEPKHIDIGETEFVVGGFSEKFTMPGGILDSKEKGDVNYSFIVGKVISFKERIIEFGEFHFSFVLAQVDTAMGIVPVAMSRDVFDLSELREGCIIAMNADVKADLSRPEDFRATSG